MSSPVLRNSESSFREYSQESSQSWQQLSDLHNTNDDLVPMRETSKQTEINFLKKKLETAEATIAQMKRQFFSDQELIKSLRNLNKYFSLEIASEKLSVQKKVKSKCRSENNKISNLRPILNEYIFPYNKFFFEKEMTKMDKGSLAMDVMDRMQIPDNERPLFWAENKKICNFMLQQYRSAVQQQMKIGIKEGLFFSLLFHYFNFFLHSISSTNHISPSFLCTARTSVILGKAVKDVSDFVEKMIDDDFDLTSIYEDKKSYAAFVAVIGKWVVKDKTLKSFKQISSTTAEDLHEIFTPQDEAFACTLFENGIHRWKEEFKTLLQKNDNKAEGMHSKKLTKDEIKLLPAYKFTERKKANKVTNEVQGWSVQGVKRYMFLVKKSSSFRNSPPFKDFSEETICLLQKLKLITAPAKRKRISVYSHDSEQSSQEWNDIFSNDEMKYKSSYSTVLMNTTMDDANTTDREEMTDHLTLITPERAVRQRRSVEHESDSSSLRELNNFNDQGLLSMEELNNTNV